MINSQIIGTLKGELIKIKWRLQKYDSNNPTIQRIEKAFRKVHLLEGEE